MVEAIALAGSLALLVAGGLRAITATRSSTGSPDWDAADTGRRLGGWVPRRTSPRSEVQGAQGNVVARSRDAVRNNPHANRIIRVLTSALVGPGLTPQFESRRPNRNVRLMELWREWAKPATCDRGGVLSVGAIQALAVRTMLVSGAAIVRRWWAPGQKVPLQLEVLEPDMLDRTKFSASPRIEYGIELDDRDRPVAFWLLRQHPGGSGFFNAGANQSVRVPAEDIAFLYRIERPGALGGIPALAPILARLRQVDEYDVATLTRQQISASMVGGVIPGDDELGEDPATLGADGLPVGRQVSSTDVDDAGNPIATIENGVWTWLSGGKEIKFFDPPTPVDSAWKKDQLQAIAAGGGITYMLLTGDLKDANYSSMKQGSGQFWDEIEAERDHTVIPMLLDRMGDWFIESCFVAGLHQERTTPMSWAARRRPSIDPTKENDADIAAINAGLESEPDLLQRRGYDPDQFLRDQVEWQVKKAKAELEAKKKIAALGGDPPPEADAGEGTPAS